MLKRILIGLILIFCLAGLVNAATIKGSVYNEGLGVENNVLIEVNTSPSQKYLAKDGNYQFELPPGTYLLTAKKEKIEIQEEVLITDSDGTFIFDLFLLADFQDEDELWSEVDEELIINDSEKEEFASWRYWLTWIIIIILFWRFGKVRKKYGSLRKFRKRMKADQKKTINQHKEELESEPGYVDKAIDILKKHDGRITQKELRKEMLYLSEAKVSLIITELEHKGKIEKVKKGRGNVILLK